MANCLLSYQNWVEKSATSVTASSEIVEAPASNLKVPILGRRHRTVQGVTNYNILVDFGQTRQVGIVVLAQPPDAGYIDEDGEAAGAFASNDFVQFRWDNVTPGVGAIFNSGSILGGWAKGYGLCVYVPTNPVTARYLHIAINAPSLAALGYCDLGHIWAGPVIQPSHNFGYGWVDAMMDDSTISRNRRSGLTLVDIGARYRALTLGLPAMNSTEAKGTIKELRRFAGMRRNILCVPDPSANKPTETIIGRLKEVPSITQPNFLQFQTVFQIIQTL